jgi:hypothetical protein
MICCNQSNVLTDTLSDPMIQAVMAADGVDPQELEQTLRTLARQLERRTSATSASVLR